MATRIIKRTYVLLANDVDKAATEGPLSPPSGLKWTIVEIRLAMDGAGEMKGKFDTELYHEIDEEDTVQFGTPQICALDVVQPHQYNISFTDTSGAGNTARATIVVEESAQGAA